MKWFDKWFMRKVHWASKFPEDTWEKEETNLIMTSSNSTRKSLGIAIHPRESIELESRGVSFNLYSANGGHVVELRNYDEKADRMRNSLHIIPHEKDLGETLNHIITYEALKR